MLRWKKKQIRKWKERKEEEERMEEEEKQEGMKDEEGWNEERGHKKGEEGSQERGRPVSGWEIPPRGIWELPCSP